MKFSTSHFYFIKRQATNIIFLFRNHNMKLLIWTTNF